MTDGRPPFSPIRLLEDLGAYMLHTHNVFGAGHYFHLPPHLRTEFGFEYEAVVFCQPLEYFPPTISLSSGQGVCVCVCVLMSVFACVYVYSTCWVRVSIFTCPRTCALSLALNMRRIGSHG